jgi:hypothetical protein
VAELVEAMEKLRQLLEALGAGEVCCLRHGLPYVTASDLVRQATCEMRLHLDYSQGRLVEPRRRELRLLVEAVLRARRSLPKLLPRRLALSLPLAGIVEGVPLVARPDAIVVLDGRVEAIVWAKVSPRPRLGWLDRLRLYAIGLAADYGGLPLREDAKLVLVAARTREALVHGLEAVRDEGARPLATSDYAIHVLAYDRAVALETLAALLAYWRGEREPAPRPSKLCSSCPYRDTCGAR